MHSSTVKSRTVEKVFSYLNLHSTKKHHQMVKQKKKKYTGTQTKVTKENT